MGPHTTPPRSATPPVDERELFRKLEELNTVALGKPRAWKPLVEKILQEDLPGLERSLRDMHEVLEAMPDVPQKPPEAHVAPLRAPDPLLRHIMLNLQKYTRIDCPILAIFADPARYSHHDEYADDPGAQEAARAYAEKWKKPAIEAFRTGLPHARVVQFANSTHDLFKTHEAECLREMKEFIASLPERVSADRA